MTSKYNRRNFTYTVQDLKELPEGTILAHSHETEDGDYVVDYPGDFIYHYGGGEWYTACRPYDPIPDEFLEGYQDADQLVPKNLLRRMAERADQSLADCAAAERELAAYKKVVDDIHRALGHADPNTAVGAITGILIAHLAIWGGT